MSIRTRRNHSSPFKAKAAADALKGEKTLAEQAKLLQDVQLGLFVRDAA